MPLLFAHISWMPEYSGRAAERIFSTHGWVLKNNKAQERSNFKQVEGRFLGYVPVRSKATVDSPGEINITRLDAAARDHVDGVTVVWFANHPRNPSQAFVVGWYRNARVYRRSQFLGTREYRMACAVGDATLLSEDVREFLVPHRRSIEGTTRGYGYGHSSIWYADAASRGFLDSVTEYMAHVDLVAKPDGQFRVERVEDAINDLDDPRIGNEAPGRRGFSGTFIVRDNRVRAQVIRRSKGSCEYCGEAGFKKADGSRFVEAHHIISLAQQGPDTMENVIALCPNHHREAHFGADAQRLESRFLAILAKIRGG